MKIESFLFEVAEALRIPVLVLALLALAVVLIETGALIAELHRRRGRGVARLDQAIEHAHRYLSYGDSVSAQRTLQTIGHSESMTEALDAIVTQRGRADSRDRIAKRMAEFDYRSLRRLERTRILVRMGPALGLMGTLIPLSPALAALADGDVKRLTDDLRVAFSVTVAGLLVGMIAFGISLVRDRLYAQDYSDVEYVAAGLARVPVASLHSTVVETASR
ncbi:MAG: MotA/TolQ/ExbB proton channel family protein [Actinobacteria bacterium]|nr:MotA/TolQ/ExbB proton channel family protein [Actinomycetota bacterium]